MSQDHTEQQLALHIKADRDGERPFVIHPQNNDLFVRTGRQLIEACHLRISVDVWFHDLEAMLGQVQAWAAQEHADQVRACYVWANRGRVTVFIVPHGDQFNFELADEIAQLSSRLVRNYNVGMVEFLQVPQDELDRFLDPAEAMLIYGDKPEAHHSVEA